MKLYSSVDMTCVNMTSEFGYDQVNISYNALLKNLSYPSNFSGLPKNIAKLNDLVTILNGAISS